MEKVITPKIQFVIAVILPQKMIDDNYIYTFIISFVIILN